MTPAHTLDLVADLLTWSAILVIVVTGGWRRLPGFAQLLLIVGSICALGAFLMGVSIQVSFHGG